MNANIKVNEMSKTITISATFSKKATLYGSAEYTLLHTVKKENPTFTVEIQRKASKHGPKLTKAFMTRYMEDLSNSNDNKVNKVIFNELVNGLSKNGDKSPEYKFGEITQWFVKHYPDYSNYSPIDALAARTKATAKKQERKSKRAQKQSAAKESA